MTSRWTTSSRRTASSRCSGRCDVPGGSPWTNAMIVGSLRIRLLLREARSLKDKRQVVKSIKDRLHNGFNVSVSEVEEQDNCRIAVLGVALVDRHRTTPGRFCGQPPRPANH